MAAAAALLLQSPTSSSPYPPLKPLRQLLRDTNHHHHHLLSFLFFPRVEQFFSCSPKKSKSITITCRVARVKEPTTTTPTTLTKEAHKYFDQAIITVRAGDGGHGAVLSLPAPVVSSKTRGKTTQDNKKKKPSYKRDSDGSLILPMGGHGGDVVIYADDNEDTLLEFHRKSRFCAKRGGNVGAMGALTKQLRDGFPGPTLRIPVPVGTVVRRKKGKVLSDLAHPGDEVLVARGGQGGISLLEMPEHQRRKSIGLSTNVMRDRNDKVLIHGQPGEEVSLELILRVVADVGLVGLPNAGKSTLLAAVTLAKPEIADYPFTTLIPNLGRLDGDPTLGALKFSSEATLADLPGLIEGAHLGKGLGRNFLRHLRRTRLLVHVVDAAAENPVKDYKTIREELRMYNPNYLARPYLVVLNKIDLPEARDRLPSLVQEISMIGCGESTNESVNEEEPIGDKKVNMALCQAESGIDEKELEDYPRPQAVVGASVLKHIGVDEVLKEIRAALRKCWDFEQVETETELARPNQS